MSGSLVLNNEESCEDWDDAEKKTKTNNTNFRVIIQKTRKYDWKSLLSKKNKLDFIKDPNFWKGIHFFYNWKQEIRIVPSDASEEKNCLSISDFF